MFGRMSLATPPRPMKLVVAALVRDAERRVLITRRRPDQPMGDLWELPGGKVEPGEAPAEALARELAEELGCGASVGRVDDVIFHRYAEFDLLMLVYACRLDGPPRAVEVAAIEWAAPAALHAYEFLPADVPLVARLAEEG
jgi:8-oxo-dGTP diphosphatase